MNLIRPDARAGAVTIVIRSQVRAPDEAFQRWRQRLGQAVVSFPGFLDQTVLPPTPPEQNHWITLQWFASEAEALAWINSEQRRTLQEAAPPSLLVPDEVHIVRDDALTNSVPDSATMIVTTQVKPGAEADYRAWQRRIASALSLANGFRGYRFEPPIEGVQDHCLVVIRFDSQTDLDAWVDSPIRQSLIREVEPLTESIRIRMADVGFDRWFQVAEGAVIRPAWKLSMLVLLVLYPTVFLFDRWVGKPWLLNRGVPPWLGIFLGNMACVTMLAFLIPWIGQRFRWWLEPRGRPTWLVDLLGFIVVVGCYTLWLLAFAMMSMGLLPWP